MKRQVLPLLALLALGIASTVPAQAQTTVVNPRIVEFDPSADHTVVGTDGQPLVQRYELRIFTLGNTQPYATTDLGKPTPEADGKIRVDFTTRVSPWPPDGNYEARVAAVGPSGLGVSDPSNAFALVSSPLPTCTYTLSSQNLSLGAASGTSSMTVTTGSTCAWTATSNATWVSPATASGTGTATLSIIVAANTASTARTATLTIGGQTLTVIQAGAACAFSASPASVPIGASGGSSSVNVTAGSGCSWTASSSVSWASVSPASGTGSGPVTITVAANSDSANRTTALTVAGQPVTVSQAALVPCVYSASPSSVAIGPSGGAGTVNVTAGSGCGWTATSEDVWASVSPASGNGPGPATITVAPNTSTSPRSTTVFVARQAINVTQAAASCTFSLSATGGSVQASGGGGSVTVSAGSGCGWTASSGASWVTVSPSAGTAAGTVTFSAGPNTGGVRSATLTIAGRPYTVTQAGIPCSTTIAPTAIPASGYSQAISITVTSATGCAWTASTPNGTWISLATTSGTGNGAVSATLNRNSTKAVRTGTIVVGGQTCTITQVTPPAPSQPKRPHVK